MAGGKATIYKLHYDEAYKDFSVGTILTAYMMEHVIQVDNVDEVDFGRGDEVYKQAWTSQPRPMGGFVAFNPSTVMGVQCFARQLVEEVKDSFKELVKPVLKPLYDMVRRGVHR